MKIKRPILRYHGGKWKLAQWIITHFPTHRVYVEPYGGGASVLMRKTRAHSEVYNDLDTEIVNVFRVIQNEETKNCLKSLLVATPYARTEFELAYEPTSDPIELARRTIIRSFMGFGSAATNSKHLTGFRANSNRSGTTPAHDWVNYPTMFDAFCERFRGVVLENRDAIDVIKQHDETRTLFYVDPPYVFSTRNTHRDCYRFEMTDTQHETLSAELHAVRGMVVLSGYSCPLYERLYPDWDHVTIDALADGAKHRTETLWFNQHCQHCNKQAFLFDDMRIEGVR